MQAAQCPAGSSLHGESAPLARHGGRRRAAVVQFVFFDGIRKPRRAKQSVGGFKSNTARIKGFPVLFLAPDSRAISRERKELVCLASRRGLMVVWAIPAGKWPPVSSRPHRSEVRRAGRPGSWGACHGFGLAQGAAHSVDCVCYVSATYHGRETPGGRRVEGHVLEELPRRCTIKSISVVLPLQTFISTTA